SVDIKLSVGQKAEVKKDSSKYTVPVTDEKGTVTTFTINAGAKSINIDGPPSAVKLDGDLASDPKVQIQGASASGTQQNIDNNVTALQNSINSGSLFQNNGSLYCDNGDWKNDWAKKALQDLTSGLQNNDWTALQSDFNALSGQHGTGDQNDCAELLFLGVYGSLGGNTNEAKAVFAKLPADLRTKVTQALSAEKGELGNDDLKNHMKGSWSGKYFGPGGTFQTHQDAVGFLNAASVVPAASSSNGSD